MLGFEDLAESFHLHCFVFKQESGVEDFGATNFQDNANSFRRNKANIELKA
jgi:hypothetical protein